MPSVAAPGAWTGNIVRYSARLAADDARGFGCGRPRVRSEIECRAGPARRCRSCKPAPGLYGLARPHRPGTDLRLLEHFALERAIMRLRILLADDHEIVRRGLRA